MSERVVATTNSTQNEGDMSSTHLNQFQDNLDKDIRVEVYHFHGDRQCSSCIAIGALAEKTVNTYFQNELKSGKLVFDHINYDDFVNGDIASKYDVKASSLWIGTYVGGKFHKGENTRVWYKINDEKDYLQYLKGVIDKRLSGDLSE